MERKENDFEGLVRNSYERFGSLAKRYYYRFARPTVTVGGSPCMIFLGNHSSGKSSLINWVLGGSPVQDVGLAPTDDGFTVIAYGENEEDICGPGALARLPAEFADLRLFGDNFLQRLRVKVRNRELLKNVTLIDTPGMIDSAEQTVDRAYNFEGVVRTLAELCDMVFFLLDPDKPGTTGETVNVFAKCLAGVEFKLRVLLNKCDAFSSMYDFARTYGTVCWNLARVLHTKDLPKIWTIYSGEAREGGNGLDLADFNRHRDEFLSVFRNAAARRRDNVFSQATDDFHGLSIRMCVVNHASRRLALFRLLYGLFGVAIAAAASVLVYHVAALRLGEGKFLAVAAGVLTALCGLFLVHVTMRVATRFMRGGLSGRVDDIFAVEYRHRIAVGSDDGLSQAWAANREETAEVVRNAPLKLPLFGEFCRRRVDSAAAKIFAAFKKMEYR
ncbi:MAG: dynamin family protein [Kiritimatiellae bacterium]|nr:dynamin family protein [Kiritimatiellia bacterium]